jgi:tRNA-specific adenosine deaminase 1
MSCSDKIAKWAACGVQGALLSRFLEPVYVDHIVIGGIQSDDQHSSSLKSECERALYGRLGALQGAYMVCTFAHETKLPNHTDLVPPYRLNLMQIHFSPLSFVHSKESVAAAAGHFSSDATLTIQGAPVPSSESV